MLRLVEVGVKAIMAVDPGALMVGTDLPSTRARCPFAEHDLEIIDETVLWGNAEALYLRC